MFMNSYTGEKVTDELWESFVMVFDPSAAKAYLYRGDRLISTQPCTFFKGVSAIDFCFPGSNEGIWNLDKISIETSYDMPSVKEHVEVTSGSPYYVNTIDSDNRIVYTYGQTAQRFTEQLTVDGMASANFISTGGGNVTGTSKIDGAKYLKITMNDGEEVWLKTKTGTDEYLKSIDINNESRWNPDMTGYYEYSQPDPEKLKGSALDVSNIVRQGKAGDHGFVQRNGDKFKFEDGTEIQFWGTNVGGAGAFPETHEEADMLVDSVAAAGYNLVRFHNIDGVFYPNIFGKKYASSGKKLDDEQMDKFCYLMAKLKERGIYWYIDGVVTRRVYSDDNLPEGISSLNSPITYFYNDAQTALENHDKLFLSYVNPYTGLAIKDDPALAIIDLNNECNLISYDMQQLKETVFYDDFVKQYNDWLKTKYSSTTELAAAWAYKGGNDFFKQGLKLGESLGNVGWIYDSSKQYNLTTGRNADDLEFMDYLMQKYFTRRINSMRNIGVKCPITGNTSWGDMQPEVTYSNANATDFVDTHHYWSHYRNDGGDSMLDAGTSFNTNGQFTNAKTGAGIGDSSSSLDADGLGLVGGIASWRVYGSPLTISEWKACPGNRYLAEGSLFVAAYGRLQNWNPCEFHFDGETNYYTRLKKGDDRPLDSVFQSSENPILRAMFPSTAVMFLRRDVKEATSGYYHNYNKETTPKDENDLFFVGSNSDYNSKTNPESNTWRGRHKFTNYGNYGLIGKTGISFNKNESEINDESIKTAADAATNGDKVYTSQTGELVTDLNNKVFKMNTANSQAVCGFIGGSEIALTNAKIKVDNEFAAVTLTSISNTAPAIANSERMLLTMAGNAQNYGQVLSEDGNTIKIPGRYPIMVEQITGTVELTGLSSSNYTVYPLTSSGERKEPIAVTKTSNGIRFTVAGDAEAMHFEIVKK